jgi:2-C-methyl-D-erythritol 4-phosphate cytidylyltransferase
MSDVQPTTQPNGALPQIWTIVVAGGSGRRFGTMKQYEIIGDRRVLDHAVDVALANCDGVVVVVPADDVVDETTNQRSNSRVHVVAGGPTRTASVRHGLTAVSYTHLRAHET